mgnify:FL=1
MGIEDGFYLLIEIVVNERWGIKRAKCVICDLNLLNKSCDN